MPRIRQLARQYAEADFRKEVEKQKIECGIRSDRELAQRLGMSGSAYSKKKKAMSWSVKELQDIVAILRPAPATVLKLLGYKEGELGLSPVRKTNGTGGN